MTGIEWVRGHEFLCSLWSLEEQRALYAEWFEEHKRLSAFGHEPRWTPAQRAREIVNARYEALEFFYNNF